MKSKLMAMLLMAGSSTMFAGVRFGVGINLGVPAPVVVARYAVPPSPGPGYVWIDGYTDEYGAYVNGYWAAPPYYGAYWVAPRYIGGRFTAGYWGGERRVDRDDYRVERNDFRGGNSRVDNSRGYNNRVDTNRGNNSRVDNSRGNNSHVDNSRGNNNSGRNNFRK